MNMNWDNIRFFLAVARTGGIRSAATTLGADQATVARRVRDLEAEMNATLFRRHRGGYDLTRTGERLVAHAEEMEVAAAALVDLATDTERTLSGNVHITTTDVLAENFLLPVLREIRDRYPEIRLNVSTSTTVMDVLREEGIDVAIRSSRPDDGDLVIRRLYTTSVGLYASSAYISRYGSPQRGAAFAGHSLVMYHRDAAPRYWQNLCGEPITCGTIVLETNSQMLLIQAIRAGAGIGFLSRDLVARDLPDLVNILPECTETVDIWLVVHPDVYRTERVRAVVDSIVRSFEEKRILQ
ncbi:LysR family transcriptional regulator [Gluconobacter cerinus]|nr:LysR family transcriptional regulator [Gluconobacter cerinus]MBS1069991.1 LysR family transcriptional regulator [Gluconobacter cerinus]